MQAEKFGIYILTYPGDFHLSYALIGSIRYLHPDVPICIIPGEGFDYQDHPFDVPILKVPDGYLAKLGYQYLCLWAFKGHFEKFLYLDADMLCLTSLQKLIDKIYSIQSPFFLSEQVIPKEQWDEIIGNPEHEQHVGMRALTSRRIGNVQLLKELDPTYDPYRYFPFNSGIFASSAGAISDYDIESLFENIRAFYLSRLNREFAWRDKELLRADQGLLNYLVNKLDIPHLSIRPEASTETGYYLDRIGLDDYLSKRGFPFNLIHYTGSIRPSPSFFCRYPLFRLIAITRRNHEAYESYKRLAEVPGYSIWSYFYDSKLTQI